MSETPPSWNQLIRSAGQSGVFAQEAKERAMSWRTCAVGELSETLGSYQTLRAGGDLREGTAAFRKCRTPEDPTLRVFGLLFAEAVNNDNPRLAWICWRGISLFLRGLRRDARELLSLVKEKLEVTYGSN